MVNNFSLSHSIFVKKIFKSYAKREKEFFLCQEHEEEEEEVCNNENLILCC